jgi:hypothetical protein
MPVRFYDQRVRTWVSRRSGKHEKTILVILWALATFVLSGPDGISTVDQPGH